MSFTYDETLLTDRDKIRFNLQDTIESKGPRPDDANFSDGEITGLLAIEGTWQRTVAAGFEVLASAWSSKASYGAPTQVNRALSDISRAFREQAKLWRAAYGGVGTAATAGGVAVIRQDAYSDDITSVESAGLGGAEYS